MRGRVALGIKRLSRMVPTLFPPIAAGGHRRTKAKSGTTPAHRDLLERPESPHRPPHLGMDPLRVVTHGFARQKPYFRPRRNQIVLPTWARVYWAVQKHQPYCGVTAIVHMKQKIRAEHASGYVLAASRRMDSSGPDPTKQKRRGNEIDSRTRGMAFKRSRIPFSSTQRPINKTTSSCALIFHLSVQSGLRRLGLKWARLHRHRDHFNSIRRARRLPKASGVRFSVTARKPSSSFSAACFLAFRRGCASPICGRFSQTVATTLHGRRFRIWKALIGHQ